MQGPGCDSMSPSSSKERTHSEPDGGGLADSALEKGKGGGGLSGASGRNTGKLALPALASGRM
eukprot:8856887-Alexandrium_andersonii.AAC.1